MLFTFVFYFAGFGRLFIYAQIGESTELVTHAFTGCNWLR